jgi:hypothetical protein
MISGAKLSCFRFLPCSEHLKEEEETVLQRDLDDARERGNAAQAAAVTQLIAAYQQLAANPEQLTTRDIADIFSSDPKLLKNNYCMRI